MKKDIYEIIFVGILICNLSLNKTIVDFIMS